jgi:hypothetical protein
VLGQAPSGVGILFVRAPVCLKVPFLKSAFRQVCDCRLGNKYQYVRTQNIRNIYTGDERRASRRDICLQRVCGRTLMQVKQGTITGEGKV